MRATAPVANGFLIQNFLPLYRQGAVPKGADTEQGFFASLDKVVTEYNLSPIDVPGKPYPYNVLLAYRFAQQQLHAISGDITLSIQHEDGETFLATTEVVGTGSTLYYIPILPLYRLMQDKKHERTCELLLGVCSYLYRHAGVPYYRNDFEYTESHYSFIEDWQRDIIESEGEAYARDCIQELYAAKHYGDIMQRRLHSPYPLKHLPEHIKKFSPKNAYQQETLQAAKQTLALLRDYPEGYIFRHTDLEDTELYDDEVIRAQQYISFVAETEGTLYTQIEQMVNEEFGNCGISEMPTLTRCFDSHYTPNCDTLDFERRVLALIENLCSLLNHTP